MYSYLKLFLFVLLLHVQRCICQSFNKNSIFYLSLCFLYFHHYNNHSYMIKWKWKYVHALNKRKRQNKNNLNENFNRYDRQPPQLVSRRSSIKIIPIQHKKERKKSELKCMTELLSLKKAYTTMPTIMHQRKHFSSCSSLGRIGSAVFNKRVFFSTTSSFCKL